jgi:predicted PurR-regulated permease PerM
METRPAESGASSPAALPGLLRPEHLYKFGGLLFLLALSYRFFDTLSRVFLLVYAAAILAVALNGIARRLPIKRRWTAGLIAVLTVAGLAAALWFGGSALLRQLRGLADSFPAMEAELRAWGDALRDRAGVDVELVSERTGQMARDFFANLSGREMLGRAGGLLEWATIPVLVFFGGIFALAKPNDRLMVPLLQAIPAERRPAFRRCLELLGTRLTGWVKGQIISMATIGVLATGAFYLIGVPYALLFGVVNGLAEFVPILGPWVGGIPAVVVAFLDDPMKGLWATVAILAIQQVESQLITPLVMAKTAEVHPFVTVFAIVLFGGLFGFLGILLALPLVLLVWTVVQTLWVERALGAGGDRVAPVVEE